MASSLSKDKNPNPFCVLGESDVVVGSVAHSKGGKANHKWVERNQNVRISTIN